MSRAAGPSRPLHERIVMLTSTSMTYLRAGYSLDFGALMTTVELRFD